LVLVANKVVPATDLKSLVAYIKAHPGEISYGSFGIGTSSHLFGDLMARQYGLDMVHVPYKGAGDVQKDLVGGRIQLMFAAAGGAVQFVRSGRVVMIGVAAPQRSPLLPGVATLSEQGAKRLDIDGWVGFFGPAQMPAPVVASIHDALVKVLADPTTRAEFEKGAYEARSSTPAQMAEMVKDSYVQWGKVAEDLGVRKE
jgi:tripartite-type tricarboxylate transporter receptor subunit TctC